MALSTLLLPIAIGYLGYFVPPLDGVCFLWQFAVIPYLVSAGVLAVLIFRARTLSHMATISFCAPDDEERGDE